jgi:hypothetical protein
MVIKGEIMKLFVTVNSKQPWYIMKPYITINSQDSAVGMATGYGLDDRGVGVRVQAGRGFSLFSPSIQWVPGELSPEVKRPVREADDSPPSSAKIKNKWIYTSTPHMPSWRNAWLVKHGDNFYYSKYSADPRKPFGLSNDIWWTVSWKTAAPTASFTEFRLW